MAKNNTLADFLRSKKEQQMPASDVDWQAKKDSWVYAVNDLYETVERLLREPIRTNDVTLRKVDSTITENFIGTYSIPVLEIMVGAERVEFLPKGVTLIGASGRVDIQGELGTITLLLTPNGWEVVLRRVPTLETVAFDQESLKNALERVMMPA
jgi:hypothetical protein